MSFLWEYSNKQKLQGEEKMMLCQVGKISDISKYHLKWLGNRKFDGVRCLAICNNGFVKLKGRNETDYASKFPEIVDDLKEFSGCFDGEITCDTFEHTSSRVHTENKLKSGLLKDKYPAIFHVFDIIENKPLIDRVQILMETGLKSKKSIRLVKYTPDLINLWEVAKKENWEGIIIKNPISSYSNSRSWNWIKIKKEITKDILVDSYSVNPAGIRVEGEGLACQITGSNSVLVKNKIDETGSCLIEVKGLEITENNKIRQIVFKDIK